MAADTYDPILGLILQGTGNNNNNWGDVFNNSGARPIARAIGGVAVHSDVGGSLDLSGSPPPAGLRADIDMVQLFDGTLTSDLTVTVPNLSKLWWFQNNTSGSFFLYVKTPGGTAIQIPQGCGRMVMGDGNNNLIRSDKDEIGSIRMSCKAAIGAGELAPNGASLLKAAFPDLYAVIGTTWGSADSLHFTLPNFTDTGRFLRSSSGSLSVGTYQANQNAAHTHTGTGTISGTTDNPGNHTHSNYLSDPGHSHGGTIAYAFSGGPGSVGGGGSYGSQISAALDITTNVTGISLTNAAGGAHTHTVSGTCSFTTASSGGTEARPEAAVVLFGIRY